MTKRKQTKKTSVPKNLARKKNEELRFSLSLVVLIGMLSFSVILFLVLINRPSAMDAKAMTVPVQKTAKIQNSKAQVPNQTLDDSGLEFTLSIPSQFGEWLYRIGEVKSLTDESISNEYLRIYLQLSGANSKNFNDRNQDVLTIRRFTADEWSDIEKGCEDGDQVMCEAGGKKIDLGDYEESGKWIYAYTKTENCPKSISSKCALADTIIKSFKLK